MLKKINDPYELSGFAANYGEYIFMEAVNRYNENLRIKGEAEHKDEFEIPFIYTREARAIHERFHKSFTSYVLDWVNNKFKDEINEKGMRVFQTEHLSALVEKAFNDAGRDTSEHKNCFTDPEGQPTRYDIVHRFLKDDGMIPLSPYAIENANKAVFLRNGEKCLFIRKDDLENYYNSVETDVWELVDKNAAEHKFKMPATIATANRLADELGLSELLMYTMNNGRRNRALEDQIVEAFLEDTTEATDKDGNPYRHKTDDDGNYIKDAQGHDLYVKPHPVKPEFIDKATNILNAITSRGYSFEVETNNRKGQLEASIEELGIKIRIIDVSNEAYQSGQYNYNCIGKVSIPSNGISIRNSVMGASSREANLITENVPNMELRAFLYYLGENIIGRNGNEIEVKEEQIDLGYRRVNRIYKDTNRSSGLVVGIDKRDERTGYSLTVTQNKRANPDYKEDPNFIYENGKPLRDPVTRKKKPVAPEVNIAKKVENARENFIAEVNMPAIIREDEKYLNGQTRPETLPPALLSTNEDIAEIQNDIWAFINHDRELIDPSKEAQFVEIDKQDLPDEIKATLKKDCLLNDRNYHDPNWSYLAKKADAFIGRFDLEADKNGELVRKINPVNVLKLADQKFSRFEENDMFSAWIGRAGLTKDNFLPFNLDDSESKAAYNNILDRSVQFDESTATTISSKADEMRKLAESAETDFEKENLLKSADFYVGVENAIKSSLVQIGVEPDNIQIDAQGVVRYQGRLTTKQASNANDTVPITGFIGQIVAPDRYGAVVPKFKSGSNTVMVPGYDAYFEEDDPKNHKAPVDRLVVEGYKQNIEKAISRQIKEDFFKIISLSLDNDDIVIGLPYSINSDLRNVTHSTMRGGENYAEEFRNEGNSIKDLTDRMASFTGKVRFKNDYIENAGYSTYTEVKKDVKNTGQYNDNAINAFNRRGRTFGNMIPAEFAGRFDMLITAKTKNTGNVLYLADGATIDADGHIEPARKADGSIDTEAVAAVRRFNPNLKHIEFDSAERIAMTRTNYESKLTSFENVGFAEITLGGWNMDDGVVISKDFADKITVPVEDKPNEFRHLKVGDKLSDLHGNKGVISLIVDRDMAEEEAESKGIAKVVKIFKDNPSLDYVASPFSAVSRMNGGTYVEANDSETESLFVDGKELKNHIGRITVDVLSQTVDHKSNVEDARRKFGSQTAWAFAEQGAWDVLKEVYGNNDKAVRTLQEYLNVLGASIDPFGNVIEKNFVLEGVQKKLFTIPENPGDIVSDNEINEKTDNKRALNRAVQRIVANFRDEISKSGGYVLLPFPIEMANGMETPEIGSLNSDMQKWVSEKLDIDLSKTNRKKLYLFPIMSPGLRKDTQLMDGSTKYNEFDLQYLRVFENAVKYSFAQQMIETLEINSDKKLSVNLPVDSKTIEYITGGKYDLKCFESDPSDSKSLPGRKQAITDIRKAMNDIKKSAKSDYDSIVVKLTTNNGPLDHKNKYNFVKTKNLGIKTKMATMVISEDPTLKVGEVSMSKKSAIELGVLDKHGNPKKFTNVFTGQTEEKGLIIYRDPVLRDGAVRYVHVVIKDDYEGIGINPVAYKCQDGDFDGDTEAVFGLNDPRALSQASTLLSYESNMLDRSQKPIRVLKMLDDGTVIESEEAEAKAKAENKKIWNVEVRPLFMNSGLDFATGESANPDLIKVRESIENRLALSYEKTRIYSAIMKANSKPGTSQTDPFDAVIKAQGVPGNNYNDFAAIVQKERQALMDEYSSYVHATLEAGVGYHAISFGSTQEHADSLLKTVLDGAKGSVDKLARYLEKSLGLTVEIGDDGKSLKVENIEKLYESGKKPGFTNKDRNGSLLATGAKTFWAGSVGEVSKRLFSSVGKQQQFIRPALEIGAYVQQTLMQAKKDVAQANTIIHNVTGVYNDFVEGRKIAKFDENGNEIPLNECHEKKGTWKKVEKPERLFVKLNPNTGKRTYSSESEVLKDFKKPVGAIETDPAVKKEFEDYLKKNNFEELKNAVRLVSVPTTRDEWLNIAKVYFTDKDGLNNPNVEPKLLEQVAEALSPNGTNIIGVKTLQKPNVQYDVANKSIPQKERPRQRISLINEVVYRKISVINLINRKMRTGEDLTLFGDLTNKVESYMAVNSVKENIIISRKEKAGIKSDETIKQFCDECNIDNGTSVKRKESKHSISAEEAGEITATAIKARGMKM